MKIADGFLLKTVAGKNIVVSVGAEVNFNGMLTLNDTGVYLWNLLQKDTTKDDILSKMLEEYDVSEEIASADIDAFIQKLRQANILED